MSETRPTTDSSLTQLLGGRNRLVGIVIALILASLVATGFLGAYKKVNIVADGRSIHISTLYNEPEHVLAQAGIAMGLDDEFRLSTKRIDNGTVITVYRAVAVTMTYHGKSDRLITGKPTVGEVAAAFGLPAETIKLDPPADTPVAAQMNIKAVDIAESIVEKEVAIPYPIMRQPDATLERGDERVIQQGEDGRKKARVKLLFEDGQEVAQQIISETILTEPQLHIVRTGTRDTIETSRGDLRFSRVRWMEATAYLPTDGGGHGITASGLRARHGIVAVDPRVIPLGTRVYVPGYGVALAADTGGDIKGDRIDLCIEDYDAAWQFGRRNVKVYILE